MPPGMRAVASGGMLPSDDRELEIGQIWKVVRRNRWTVITCLLIPVAGAIGYILLRTPVYESSTMIRIAGTPITATSVEAMQPGDAVSTEMAVLGSQSFAAGVVDDAKLQVELTSPTRVQRRDLLGAIQVLDPTDTATLTFKRQSDSAFRMSGGPVGASAGPYAVGQPVHVAHTSFTLLPAATAYKEIDVTVQSRDAALLALQKALKIVRPDPEADVILVKYRGTDAQMTQWVLSSLSARFMSWRQGVLTADARSRSKLLRQEIDTLSTQLAVAEEQLRNFQQSQQIVDPVAEATTDVTRLAQMQADRNAVDAERSALAKMLATANVAAALRKPGDPSPYTKLMAFPTLLRNQATSELFAALEAAEDQRAQLMQRRTAEDPDVQVTSTRVREIEEQLRQTVVTYTEGLTQQEAALDSSIQTFNKQLHDVPERTMEFARLDRKPKALSDLYTMLQTQLKDAEVAQAAVDPTVQLVDSAVTAVKPVSPQPLLDGVAGVILGLLLAMGVVFMREHLDPYVHTRADVQRVMGVPVLGLVPHMRMGRRRAGKKWLSGARRWAALRAGDPDALAQLSGDSVSAAGTPAPLPDTVPDDADARAQASEAFARLHTNIQFLQNGATVKTVIITSSLPEDGKTTTATNLALASAQRGQRVLLIDADLRRGAVHAAFGVDRSPGLASLLHDGTPFEQVARVFEVPGGGAQLYVVTSGPLTSSPAALLASDRMRELIRRAETMFDVIVIDSPPINIVSDAAILSTLAQGVVVVVRTGITARDALAYATEQLRMVRAPVVGAILNDVDFRRDAMYDDSYRYYGGSEMYHVPDRDLVEQTS